MMHARVSAILLMTVSFLSALATNHALLVGIGAYDSKRTGWEQVHGDNDVALLKPLLQKKGFTDVVCLSNEQATKAGIVNALKDLALRCKPGDKVYFHFSGHGQPIRDDNHDEKAPKKYDESIIPYDACRDSRKMSGKYAGENHLVDDELCPLLDAVKRRLGTKGELFVAVDACYSHGIEKDEVTDLDPELLRYMRGTDHVFFPPAGSSYLKKLPKPKGFSRGARMSVVTACRENERNLEYKAPTGSLYGSLSYYISSLLKKDADFSRWIRCFKNRDYARLNIIQSVQHPSIEIYP